MGSKLYTRGERIFKWVSLVLLLVICVATLAPFVLILASSLTDETTLITYGYSFWPQKFSMDSYLFRRGSCGVLGGQGVFALPLIRGAFCVDRAVKIAGFLFHVFFSFRLHQLCGAQWQPRADSGSGTASFL